MLSFTAFSDPFSPNVSFVCIYLILDTNPKKMGIDLNRNIILCQCLKYICKEVK